MKGLLIISGLGILAMLAEIFKFKKLLLPMVLLGIVAAYAFNFMEWANPFNISYFNNMIAFDKLAQTCSSSAISWIVRLATAECRQGQAVQPGIQFGVERQRARFARSQ